jgi:molybdopterin-guanine dinucleotide biosynthesis protein A
MIIQDNTLGVILAGGTSSRMGRNKAFLELQGKPLIMSIAETLKQVFSDVILIANDRHAYEHLGLKIFPDLYQHCGPLGGIHAAFSHSNSSSLFVTACDTPCISPEFIRYLVSFPSAKHVKIPVADNGKHLLCGIFHREVFPVLVQQLERKELKVMDFLERVLCERIPIHSSLSFYTPELFFNINTEDDLRAISKISRVVRENTNER